MRRLLYPFFRVIVIVCLTFIMLEFVLQIAFLSLPRSIIWRMPQYWERYGMQLETEFGARLYPANQNVSFEVNQFSGDLFRISCLSLEDAEPLEPYTIEFKRDSLGFRNPEPWQSNADLVVLGDSFTDAEVVNTPYWDTLSDNQLILGLAGSGTLEQKILFERFAKSRSPQVVLLEYFAGNDLLDNISFDTMQRDGMTFADKAHKNHHLLEYSVTFHLAMYIRDILTKSSKSNCVYPVTTHIAGQSVPLAFYNSFIILLTVPPDQLLESNAFKLTNEAIVDLANEVKALDSQFVLVYIPHKAEVYWNYLDPETQQKIINALPRNPAENVLTNAESVSINIESQRMLIKEIADTNGFDMLDLTQMLTDAIDNGQSPYFFADTHWNQVGHDIARRAIVEFLSQSTLDKNPNS